MPKILIFSFEMLTLLDKESQNTKFSLSKFQIEDVDFYEKLKVNS